MWAIIEVNWCQSEDIHIVGYDILHTLSTSPYVKKNMKSSYGSKEQFPKMIIENSLPYIGHPILCCQNI